MGYFPVLQLKLDKEEDLSYPLPEQKQLNTTLKQFHTQVKNETPQSRCGQLVAPFFRIDESLLIFQKHVL